MLSLEKLPQFQSHFTKKLMGNICSNFIIKMQNLETYKNRLVFSTLA
jgi:hypothetical protein